MDGQVDQVNPTSLNFTRPSLVLFYSLYKSLRSTSRA